MCEERILNSMDGIDLQDSVVLDWTMSEIELVFHIEASIWPSSKHYTKPKLEDYTCYKKAVLRFVKFESVCGLKDKIDVSQSSDASGEKDYGSIDSLSATKDGFCIEGDFGSIKVTGGEVDFEVHT